MCVWKAVLPAISELEPGDTYAKAVYDLKRRQIFHPEPRMFASCTVPFFVPGVLCGIYFFLLGHWCFLRTMFAMFGVVWTSSMCDSMLTMNGHIDLETTSHEDLLDMGMDMD